MDQLRKVFQTLMEPELLFLFLQCVGRRVEAALPENNGRGEGAEALVDWEGLGRALRWFDWVRDNCRSFSLLLSLLKASERRELCIPLEKVKEVDLSGREDWLKRVNSLLEVLSC